MLCYLLPDLGNCSVSTNGWVAFFPFFCSFFANVIRQIMLGSTIYPWNAQQNINRAWLKHKLRRAFQWIFLCDHRLLFFHPFSFSISLALFLLVQYFCMISLLIIIKTHLWLFSIRLFSMKWVICLAKPILVYWNPSHTFNSLLFLFLFTLALAHCEKYVYGGWHKGGCWEVSVCMLCESMFNMDVYLYIYIYACAFGCTCMNVPCWVILWVS